MTTPRRLVLLAGESEAALAVLCLVLDVRGYTPVPVCSEDDLLEALVTLYRGTRTGAVVVHCDSPLYVAVQRRAEHLPWIVVGATFAQQEAMPVSRQRVCVGTVQPPRELLDALDRVFGRRREAYPDFDPVIFSDAREGVRA